MFNHFCSYCRELLTHFVTHFLNDVLIFGVLLPIINLREMA